MPKSVFSLFNSVFPGELIHFPQIAVIDTKELPEEKQQQVKIIMAEQRLGRRIKGWFNFVKKALKPLFSLVKTMITSWQQRSADLEERYKIERLTSKSATESGKESIKFKVARMVKQAHDYAHQEDFSKAEETYIGIIKLDPQSIDAFEGLGEVYAKQKKFDEAEEVYKYILKLMQDQDESELHLASIVQSDSEEQYHSLILATRAKILYEVALVYKAQNLEEKVYTTLKEAIDYEENNPKYLDAFLDICIIKKDKKLSHETFFKLKQVNPDNKKLDEFEERLTSLET